MKNYQKRDKFFYAVNSIFPDWPYPSRLAIGMNFEDFKAIKASSFTFKVSGKFYQIERSKALTLGNKYVFKGGKLPNLIPKEEFTVLEVEVKKDPKEEQMIFGEMMNKKT